MATLGTASLANEHVDNTAQSRIIDLALKLAFGHLGHFYRFRPLYQFKTQFGHTCWEGRYLASSPQRFNPVMRHGPHLRHGLLPGRKVLQAWLSTGSRTVG